MHTLAHKPFAFFGVLPVLVLLMMAPRLLASPVVEWAQYSKAGAQMTVTGNYSEGLPAGHYVSPNGLWDWTVLFGSLASEEDHVEFSDGFIVFGEYHGSTPFTFSTPGGFGETYNSFADASSGDGIFRWETGDEYIGDGTIRFSGTDFNDLSTWKYVFGVSVERPEFVAGKVPDAGATWILLASAVTALVSIRRFSRRRVRITQPETRASRS